MTTENYYVAAYWANRPEQPPQCARRTKTFLGRLATIDTAFSRWYRRARTRSQALDAPVDVTGHAIEELFAGGRTRRDVGKAVMPDLGSRISLWNGDDDAEAISLTVQCGGYASTPQTWIPNSCVLELPQSGAAFHRLATADMAMTIVEAMVTSFDPDWAVATSDALRDSTPTPEAGTPLVGWITFLRGDPQSVQRLPSPARVARLPTAGALVVASSERLTGHNPMHAMLIGDIRGALTQAGILRRIA